MIDSRKTTLERLRTDLVRDEFWMRKLRCMSDTIGVHLAIFNEPYLSFIQNGRKTIESRFSKNNIAPYNRVAKGEIVLLKRTGGPIVGLCVVSKVWYYQIDPGTIDIIRHKFGAGICPADSSFWNSKSESSYCSLIWIDQYTSIDDMVFYKRDRRGWVVLK